MDVYRGHTLLLKDPLIAPVEAVASLVTSDGAAPQLDLTPDVLVIINVSTGLRIAVLKSRKTI